jgi:hypothetical protein
MMSAAHPAASLFLLIAPSFFLLLFGLPLLVAPLAWARLFRWWIPEDVRLAQYLGRSLGCVVVPLMVVFLRAAPTPELSPWTFELSAAISGLLVIIHIVGLIERSQPWTEHVEIGMYAVVGVVAAVLRAGL